jgi:pyruvate/2-oxoacid:ferredoxin oxidoreductase beta subunit
MFRIRFHGRGGQGMKTASRILGTAFFKAGYQVQTGVWPLKEYIDGEVRHTKAPKQRKPVDEYLKLQGRFKHLFEPHRDEQGIAEIQTRIDAYWDKVGRG